MNVREGFMSLLCATGRRRFAATRLFARNLRVYLAAIFQSIHAHGDYHVAGFQAGSNLGLIAFGGAHHDGTHGHGLIRIHQPDVGTRGVALNGGIRQQRNVLLLLHQQSRVHELAGKQLAVRIAENSAQL